MLVNCCSLRGIKTLEHAIRGKNQLLRGNSNSDSQYGLSLGIVYVVLVLFCKHSLRMARSNTYIFIYVVSERVQINHCHTTDF